MRDSLFRSMFATRRAALLEPCCRAVLAVSIAWHFASHVISVMEADNLRARNAKQQVLDAMGRRDAQDIRDVMRRCRDDCEQATMVEAAELAVSLEIEHRSRAAMASRSIVTVRTALQTCQTVSGVPGVEEAISSLEMLEDGNVVADRHVRPHSSPSQGSVLERYVQLWSQRFLKIVPSDKPPCLFVFVAHLVQDMLPMLTALKFRGHKVLVIPKSSSVSRSSLEMFWSRGIVVYKMDSGSLGALARARPSDFNGVARGISEDVKRRLNAANLDEIGDLLREIDGASGGRGGVRIVDTGGYFHKAIAEISGKLQHRLQLVVEDTENGHQKYEAAGGHIRCPLVSVARSSCKVPEDAAVGESIVDATNAALRTDLGTRLRDPRFAHQGYIMVIGYGKIGSSIVRSLERHGLTDIVVVEGQQDLVARAASMHATQPIPVHHTLSADGKLPAELARIFQRATLIFSATGSKALQIKHLTLLPDSCVIASVTSPDDEYGFSLDELEPVEELRRIQVLRVPGHQNTLLFVDRGEAPNLAVGWGASTQWIHVLQYAIVLALFRYPGETRRRGFRIEAVGPQIEAEAFAAFQEHLRSDGPD